MDYLATLADVAQAGIADKGCPKDARHCGLRPDLLQRVEPALKAGLRG